MRFLGSPRDNAKKLTIWRNKFIVSGNSYLIKILMVSEILIYEYPKNIIAKLNIHKFIANAEILFK